MDPKQLYFEMLRIRTVEEAVADAYGQQQMRCPVHLSIGQEAVPVGVSVHLSDADKVYSNHRCHAHYLAKGGTIRAMIAELHGKRTGCAKGKGGSMHLVDTERGMMGSSALVGGTISMAVGAAFSMVLEKKDTVAVTYFGDGGSEEGVFYESLNFAVLHKLPVLFVCENNLYATYSHQRVRQATSAIYKRGASFGIAAEQLDGNDVNRVVEAAERAVNRARGGEGPTLLECLTYRWRDHVGPNYDIQIGYRTQEELDEWVSKCPILRLRTQLREARLLSENEDQTLHAQLKEEVEEAFSFALKSPLPAKDEVFTDVYA